VGVGDEDVGRLERLDGLRRAVGQRRHAGREGVGVRRVGEPQMLRCGPLAQGRVMALGLSEKRPSKEW
jgi:hypothetical protein